MNILFHHIHRGFLVFFLSVMSGNSLWGINLPDPPQTFLELSSPPFGNGMFNVFSMVLGLLDIYDRGIVAGVKVDFKDQGVYYDSEKGPNWWEYYFEPIYLGTEAGANAQITSMADQSNLSGLCEFQLSRKRCCELLKRYVHLKPHIQKKLDSFIRKKFVGALVIGVHYRGTDKLGEAPRVSYDEVKEKIDSVMKEISMFGIKIFVATDEQAFLDYMKENFPEVIFLEDGIRSANGLPVHHYSAQQYKKGEDALMDCLLLSRCNLLIRTSSSLSLFSSYFNPSIPIINLSYRYGMNH